MLLPDRKTALEKVAAFLTEMDSRLTVAGILARRMYLRDITGYLGLTLATVSRVLWLLQDGGVLAFSGVRQIALRDRRRLAAVNR